MERQSRPLPSPEKLIETAAIDYPTASEIMVSFPDKWALIRSLERGDTPLYVAGFPRSYEQPQADHFFALSPEMNRSMTAYRLYKLFEP